MYGLTLAFLPALVMLVLLLALLPVPTLRVALSKARRGGRAPSRSERELRRAKRFAIDAVALPVAAVAGAGLFIYVLHHVVPDSAAAQIFGTHTPENHTMSQGLVDQIVASEAAVRAEAASAAHTLGIRDVTWDELFWQHWPLHPIAAGSMLVLMGRLLVHRHLRVVRSYQQGVERRRRRGVVRDAARALATA